MSTQHVAWALDQSPRAAVDKLALIGIAVRLGHENTSWIDLESLATFCCVNFDFLQLALVRLGHDGLVDLHMLGNGQMQITLGPHVFGSAR